MKRLLIIAAALAVTATATAAQAPVKQAPLDQAPSEYTINDCVLILSGLEALDRGERSVVLNSGKPGEQLVKLPYEFASGGLRLDIAHNIAVLTAVRNEAQPAQQRIFQEVVKTLPEVDGKPVTSIPPGTPAAAEYDRQMKELTARPCRAQLTKINPADLNVDKNQFPLAVLAAIDKLFVR